jgi:putative endonuclease
VLYVGVTNNLEQRLAEHYFQRGASFTSMYNVFYLVYYEQTPYILNALRREKQIKRWARWKKDALINSFNPEWKFLNQ